MAKDACALRAVLLSRACLAAPSRRTRCAVRSGGSLVCWGSNAAGALGNGSTTDSNVPVAVSGLHDARAISAGAGTTCAVRKGGSVACWGDNNNTELLGESLPNRHADSRVPVTIPITAAGSGTATGAGCSRATARQLASRFQPGGRGASHDVEQVLCGAFAGPGSTAIAVTFHYAGCIPLSHWAVFVKDAGRDWRLVLARNEVGARLARAGSGIRVSWSVSRQGDAHCLFSGGERTRVWRWNGQRFVGGPTRQSKPPTGGGGGSGGRAARGLQFSSPSGNLLCAMTEVVFCQSYTLPQHVTLNADGALSICHGQRCAGNPGEGDVFPQLAYGAHRTFGRFRCDSLPSGVRCVVVQSGRGFLIDSRTIRHVG